MSPRDRNPIRPTDRTDRADDGISVLARLATSRILPEPQDQHVVVTIAAPDPPPDAARMRPPLSLAIVVDRSGSMRGAPIENAKAAALAMLRQLEDRDAFAVVSYANQAAPVLAMARATEARKAMARAAIEMIDVDGGTCLSCGLDAGAAELARSPIRDGLRRLLLISDGRANAGVFHPDALARLAASEADRGDSISTVGVGLDYDDRTMRGIAEVGRGNYYFAEDTVALSQMFVHELATLSQTVASEVRLRATAAPGVRIEQVYGYPMTREGDGVVVPIADLRAGELRKLVFRVALTAASPGTTREIARIDVAWRGSSDASARVAHATAEADVASGAAEVAASVDPAAMQAVERALSAQAQAVRASRALAPEVGQQLDDAANDAIGEFARAPAKAKKPASVNAHELAR